MTYVYNEQMEHVITLNYIYEDFIKEPDEYYSKWQDGYHAAPEMIYYPIVRDNGLLEEMTREEKIFKLGMKELLANGEYIDGDSIKMTPVPEGLIEPVWSVEFNEWIEGADEEKYMLKRKDKIIEYIKIKRETTELKEMADEFETEETIALMESQMNQLKKEATELGEKVKLIKDNKEAHQEKIKKMEEEALKLKQAEEIKAHVEVQKEEEHAELPVATLPESEEL